jgi:transcription antitermination factor NusB
MSGRILSNRRNTRENLLMFFYSKEFQDHDLAITEGDAVDFFKSVEDIRQDDKLENIRDSVKEVFDNVKITKLEPGDIIEFSVPFVKDKISMTFAEMDDQNVKDGFFKISTDIADKYGIVEDVRAEGGSPSESHENLKFFTSYVNNYFRNLNYVDGEIKANLENWDFGRISIVDKIILRMGIVELKYFPEIPPKVTINEAIELGKKYSTEKSNVFINGILNKLKNILRGDPAQDDGNT